MANGRACPGAVRHPAGSASPARRGAEARPRRPLELGEVGGQDRVLERPNVKGRPGLRVLRRLDAVIASGFFFMAGMRTERGPPHRRKYGEVRRPRTAARLRLGPGPATGGLPAIDRRRGARRRPSPGSRRK